MAVAINALVELATVKTELGISVSTYDTYLTRLINAASDYIARYCQRTFYYTAAITEKVVGYGGVRMTLARVPIVAVTSITYNGGTISPNDYQIQGTQFIYRAWGTFWTASRALTVTTDGIIGTENPLYTVVYGGGYVTANQVTLDGTLTRSLPWDLEDACIQMVVSRYRQQGQDPSILSESLLDYSVTYGNRDVISLGLKSILDSYIFPVVSG